MAKKPSPSAKVEKHRLEGFQALTASDKSESSAIEDADGERLYWKELSAEAKVGRIASNAAYYDIPFEPFAQAVRDALADLPPAAREEAALRFALRNERELHELERILPPHDRLESYPLIEQLQDTLNYYEGKLSELENHAKVGSAFKQVVAELAAPSTTDSPHHRNGQKDGIRGTLRHMLEDAKPQPSAAKSKQPDHPKEPDRRR